LPIRQEWVSIGLARDLRPAGEILAGFFHGPFLGLMFPPNDSAPAVPQSPGLFLEAPMSKPDRMSDASRKDIVRQIVAGTGRIIIKDGKPFFVSDL
jgi:hypothetical protein